MDQTAHRTRAPEDLIVGVALAATWFVYLFGGLYVLGPVLGDVLVIDYWAKK